jgi:ferredoxin
MHISSATMLYFSPSGTTRKIIRAIVAGMRLEASDEINLTRPAARSAPLPAIAGDLLIIGMPVYEERIPPFVRPCLEQIQGRGQPAVLVAVYGNVGAGLVLAHLADLAEARGFHVIAGAAFVAEHSFSHDALPIAAGRPDANDLQAANAFGEAVLARLAELDELAAVPRLTFPARLPLMARVLPEGSAAGFTHAPAVARALCTDCGACARVCPRGAIDPQSLEIDEALCIRCFACVRACRPAARAIRLKRAWLVRRAMHRAMFERREPQIYR